MNKDLLRGEGGYWEVIFPGGGNKQMTQIALKCLKLCLLIILRIGNIKNLLLLLKLNNFWNELSGIYQKSKPTFQF